MRIKKTVSPQTWEKEYKHLEGQINLFTGTVDVSWDTGKRLSKDRILQNVMEYIDRHGLCVNVYNGISEDGYDDEMFITANWNTPSNNKNDRWYYKPNGSLTRYGEDQRKIGKLGNFLSDQLNIQLGWSDEWSMCDECYKAIRIKPDSYSWQKSYIIDETGYYVCSKCIENDIEGNLCAYFNTTDKALPSWCGEYASEIGFECVEDDPYFKNACKRYTTGWHPGQNDTPEKAIANLKEIFGDRWFDENMDYLFIIGSVGQFEVDWSILVRSKHYHTKED